MTTGSHPPDRTHREPKERAQTQVQNTINYMKNISPSPAFFFMVRTYAIHICPLAPLHTVLQGLHVSKVLRDAEQASSLLHSCTFSPPLLQVFYHACFHGCNMFPLGEIPEHGTVESKVMVFKKSQVLGWAWQQRCHGLQHTGYHLSLPNNCFLYFRSVSVSTWNDEDSDCLTRNPGLTSHLDSVPGKASPSPPHPLGA